MEPKASLRFLVIHVNINLAVTSYHDSTRSYLGDHHKNSIEFKPRHCLHKSYQGEMRTPLKNKKGGRVLSCEIHHTHIGGVGSKTPTFLQTHLSALKPRGPNINIRGNAKRIIHNNVINLGGRGNGMSKAHIFGEQSSQP